MIDKLLASIGLAVCVVMLVRLCLGTRRQQRFDAAVRRAAHACQRGALRVWHWPRSRRAAKRAAEEAIRRAQDGVQRDGNIYRPRSFRDPRKPH
jgi:hypothetical protein